jgi:transcription elongation GreA/GreB family factor
MGAALLGHKKGDKIKVQAPVGVLEYKVKSIRYES